MKLFIVILILLPQLCFCQKQGYIWHLGDSCGLDFSSGTPVVIASNLNNATGYATEGTASISDSSGSLLFYAHASKVWNRNHQLMPNGSGLLGGPSSTQGAFIIPKPGSDSLFYLFTLDQFQNNLANGLRYHVIDMCLDDGLGDVIAGQKNILLLDSAGEKMCGTNHANGTDYWLVVHQFFTDAFYAYQISSSGIIDTVVSHIGLVHLDQMLPSNTAPAIGQMKISPDGSKIAYALSNANPCFVQLFDFNNATGVVSNLVNLPPDAGEYGVSFSQDNTKLYISTLGSHQIFQYDVSAGNAAAIIASKTLVGNDPTGPTAGMQLGPDGKIYIAGAYLQMAVINNPNVAGPACNFVFNAINLGHVVGYGMTNFIDSYNYHNGVVKCKPDPKLSTDENPHESLVFNIFPNPVVNELTIYNVRSAVSKIEIYNSLGKKVFVQPLNAGNQQPIVVDVSALTGGVYILQMTADNNIISREKFIKQ